MFITNKENNWSNKMNTWKITSAAFLVLMLGVAGCADVLDNNPPDVINSKNIFNTASGFDNAINGVYSQVVRIQSGDDYASTNQLMSAMMDTGTDNMYAPYRNGAGQVLNEWGDRARPDQSRFATVWRWLYQIVNASNNIIMEGENSTIDWTMAEQNAAIAHGKLFRAFAYYHLTNLYGDVPLLLEPSSGSNIRFDFERTSAATIQLQIIDDLEFAALHLPTVPPASGKVSKGVAQIYLGRVYLAKAGKSAPYSQADLQKAKGHVNDLINNGPFAIMTERFGVQANEPGTVFSDLFIDGNETFESGNTETVWSFQNEYSLSAVAENHNIMRRWNVNRYYNFGLAITDERGGRGIGRHGPTNFQMELYDPSDDRGSDFAWRKYYIYKEGDKVPSGKSIGDTVYVYYPGIEEKTLTANRPSPRKWDSSIPEDVSGSRQYDDQPFMRLAMAYLLLGEAQYKLGELNDAASTFNVLRDRANAPRIEAADLDIDWILDERARELYGEERRRYTLNRNGKLLERVRKYNQVGGPNIEDHHVLFPIPQEVIDANNQTEMTQNPGY